MASSSLGSQSCVTGISTLVSQLFCSRAALKRVRELRSSIADGPAIPSAAKDLENGLTAAANPWGCPPPAQGWGGVRQPLSPAGGAPGRRRSESSWWTRRATRATSGADFVSTHRNARTPSFAVGAGQSQSGRPSLPPPRIRRSVACPRRLAKSYDEMDINACCFADIKASIRWPPPQNETRATAPRA